MTNELDADFLAQNRQDFWKNYLPFFKTNTRQATYRREYIANIMYDNKINSVLELGCNSGGNLLYIHKKCPTIKIVGVDICKDAIEYGKNVEKNPTEMKVASLYDLSQFEDNSFDMVFTCTVLIHIPSEKVEGVIRNMIRISKNFVMNIEDHQQTNKVYWCREGIPQRWETNYKEIYDKIGLNINMHDVVELMGKTSGGANKLMWMSKKGDTLVLGKNK